MLKSLWSVLILAFSFACLGQTCEHIGPSNFQTVRVDFVGADSVDPASIGAMIANLEKDILEECQFKEELQERIRDQFQRFGYFKVDVHNDITYRQLSANADLQKVSVRVMVDPGRQYRLDHLAFTGGTVFSADELRALVPMKDGDIFDVERMREGLKNLRDKYVAKGYINFTPVPNTEIDDQRDRITITFDLDEGQQFRVGRLILNGVEPYAGAGQQLLDAWKPHEGQIYDCELWHKLFDSRQKRGTQGAVSAILSSEVRRSSEPKISVNNNTKTIDFHFEWANPK
ncbi:MAG: POTRA domain-containing protein [Terriglobales bacterium]